VCEGREQGKSSQPGSWGGCYIGACWLGNQMSTASASSCLPSQPVSPPATRWAWPSDPQHSSPPTCGGHRGELAGPVHEAVLGDGARHGVNDQAGQRAEALIAIPVADALHSSRGWGVQRNEAGWSS
jgi:hypothetical protein